MTIVTVGRSSDCHCCSACSWHPSRLPARLLTVASTLARATGSGGTSTEILWIFNSLRAACVQRRVVPAEAAGAAALAMWRMALAMWRMLRMPSCTAPAQRLFGASLRSCSQAGRPARLRHSLRLQTATSWQPFPVPSAPCMTDTILHSGSPALTLSMSFPWQRVWPSAP